MKRREPGRRRAEQSHCVSQNLSLDDVLQGTVIWRSI